MVTLEKNVGGRAHLRFQKEASSREPDFSYSIDGGECLRRGRGYKGFFFFFPHQKEKDSIRKEREAGNLYSR